jgi:hypothetical protein
MTTKTVEKQSLGAEGVPPPREEIQLAYQVHTLVQMLWGQMAPPPWAAAQGWMPQQPWPAAQGWAPQQPWTAQVPPTGLDPFASAQSMPWAQGWPGAWAGPTPAVHPPGAPCAAACGCWIPPVFPR